MSPATVIHTTIILAVVPKEKSREAPNLQHTHSGWIPDTYDVMLVTCIKNKHHAHKHSWHILVVASKQASTMDFISYLYS